MEQRISVLQPDTTETTVTTSLQPAQSPTAPTAPSAPELQFSDVPQIPDGQTATEAQEAAEQASEAREQQLELLDEAKQRTGVTPPTPPAQPEASEPSSPSAPEVAKTQEQPTETAPDEKEASIKRDLEPGTFTVQIAALRDEDAAIAQVNKLRQRGYDAYYMVSDLDERGVWYRVRIGEYETLEQARESSDIVKDQEQLYPFPIEVN
nr:SPOR domain-containing protein [Desulfurispira natronophila]